MDGSFIVQVDPVNGQAILETYGPACNIPGAPDFLAIGFPFQWVDDGATAWDELVTLAEVHKDVTDGCRKLIIDVTGSAKIQIMDKDSDQISGGVTALSAGTIYWVYWYIDFRSEVTRDILWVYVNGAWNEEGDVSGWGDTDTINRFTLGSGTGKTLPTEGGKMYYNEVFIEEDPVDGGLGAVTTRYKKADGNGADTGEWLDHAFGDVDEVDTTVDTASKDSANAAGEKQTYDVEAVTGDEVPLAVQAVGAWQRTDTSVTGRTYLYDGTTRDFGETMPLTLNNYSFLGNNSIDNATKCYNFHPDGSAWTKNNFASIEVGAEVVARTSGQLDLTQIGAEYMIAHTGDQGTQPATFPTDTGDIGTATEGSIPGIV